MHAKYGDLQIETGAMPESAFVGFPGGHTLLAWTETLQLDPRTSKPADASWIGAHDKRDPAEVAGAHHVHMLPEDMCIILVSLLSARFHAEASGGLSDDVVWATDLAFRAMAGLPGAFAELTQLRQRLHPARLEKEDSQDGIWWQTLCNLRGIIFASSVSRGAERGRGGQGARRAPHERHTARFDGHH